MNRLNKAVFLDKDGTLIIDVPYNVDPNKITLSDNCTNGLRKLQNAGYMIIVVSNQSGVARGYFKEEDLVVVEQKITAMLSQEGITLNGFYYCPHHPDGLLKPFAVECDCRKPAPGLLFKAAERQQIDLKSSWMIGDILNDIEAGNRAGCKTILIDNGNETEWKMGEYRSPLIKAKNIDEAATYILKYNVEKLAGL